MSCKHANPPGYLYCGSCGGALEPTQCRCGFAAASGDLFCGRCGAALIAESANGIKGTPDVDHRFDLEYLALQAAEENKFLTTTHKARVTQDDIRKLLATRRKKL